MATKKAFLPIVAFLEANKNKKVSTILAELKEMVESKTMEQTVLYNEDSDGTKLPFAIFCYYHKQWELLDTVEYGKKASTKSGFNTMCKVGTRLWTKREKDYKASKIELLTQVSKGEVTPEDIPAHMSDAETARKMISPEDIPEGVQTVEQVYETLTEEIGRASCRERV